MCVYIHTHADQLSLNGRPRRADLDRGALNNGRYGFRSGIDRRRIRILGCRRFEILDTNFQGLKSRARNCVFVQGVRRCPSDTEPFADAVSDDLKLEYNNRSSSQWPCHRWRCRAQYGDGNAWQHIPEHSIA